MHLHRKFNRQHNTGFATSSTQMLCRVPEGYTEFCKVGEYKRDRALLHKAERAMKIQISMYLDPERPEGEKGY